MKRTRLWWALPALLGAALFSGLGVWQLQRAAWKERVLVAWSHALNAAPRPYVDVVGSRQSLPRRDQLQSVGAATFALPVRTTLSGSWDAQVTVLLDNQRLGERVGVLVFTRFVPDNGATPLLVNRGWVALDARPALPDLPTPSEGAVRFSGLLVPPPAAGLKLGSDQWQLAEKPPLLTWLDIGTLAGQVGPLFDGVLQLDADAADGFVRRWQALPNTLPPEKHRGYAVQWFGFALATVVFYFILAFPRRP